MPANVPEKIKFLSGEIDGVRSRMPKHPNGLQIQKLQMLTDIRDDYEKSLAAAKAREEGQAA